MCWILGEETCLKRGSLPLLNCFLGNIHLIEFRRLHSKPKEIEFSMVHVEYSELNVMQMAFKLFWLWKWLFWYFFITDWKVSFDFYFRTWVLMTISLKLLILTFPTSLMSLKYHFHSIFNSNNPPQLPTKTSSIIKFNSSLEPP